MLLLSLPLLLSSLSAADEHVHVLLTAACLPTIIVSGLLLLLLLAGRHMQVIFHIRWFPSVISTVIAVVIGKLGIFMWINEAEKRIFIHDGCMQISRCVENGERGGISIKYVTRVTHTETGARAGGGKKEFKCQIQIDDMLFYSFVWFFIVSPLDFIFYLDTYSLWNHDFVCQV